MTDCLPPHLAHPDLEFPIEVSHNPTIVQYPSGKTWACAGSHVMQVPTGTPRQDLRQWMKWELRRPQYEIVEIKGSRGDIYKVRRDPDTREVRCDCPGFKWRGKCKHLTKAFPA